MRRIIVALEDELVKGTPIVVLEPACLSVFKAELPMMLPHDEQARRLAQQTVLLCDFVRQQGSHLQFARPARRALLHGHCHQKSVIGFEGAQALLRESLELDLQVPDTGCCGMAGSFGFEARKYEVSMRCAERVVLPAVRAAANDTLIVTDGYSCREQIVQATGRRVLHSAELLRMALPETP